MIGSEFTVRMSSSTTTNVVTRSFASKTLIDLRQRPQSILRFQVEVRKSSTGNFCCCVPEARSAASGDTVEELIEIIQDLIEDYIEDCKEEKISLPVPQQRHEVRDEGFVKMAIVQIPV